MYPEPTEDHLKATSFPGTGALIHMLDFVRPWRKAAGAEPRNPSTNGSGAALQELPMLAWPWDLYK